MDPPLIPSEDGAADPQSKLRTAALSLASNSILILLKVVAGSIAGSVAILTEEQFAGRGVVGYHELRTRRAGAAATSTCTSISAAAPRSRTPTAPPTSSRT